MKRRKIVIGSMVSLTVVVLTLLVVVLFMGKSNGVSIIHIKATDGMKEGGQSFAASSYQDIYSRLTLARLKEYMKQRKDSDLTTGAMMDESAKAVEDAAPANPSDNDAASYGQTNIQVENVDEGDIIKNDGKYIYCYHEGKISIVAPTPLHMKVVATVKPVLPVKEFYVSGDYMVVLSQSGDQYYGNGVIYEDARSPLGVNTEQYVRIEVYDIKDHTKPELISMQKQAGYLQTSRISDGYLYCISQKAFYEGLQKNKPSTYVPSINGEVMECKDVLYSKTDDQYGYLVVTSLRVDQPDRCTDAKAILCGSYQYYVSTSNIYIVDQSYDREVEETILTKIGYKKGKLTPLARGKVKGCVNDNFSLDEHEGYLRMVTTVYDDRKKEVNSYNNLYVLDASLQEVGSITRLAKNEMIYSSRFMGDVGYFVTFRQVDPLFSVDLSDPKNPKIIGALKISGFSSYLHFYGKNLLLGVGEEADEKTGRSLGLKLSMFDISNPKNVKELHKKYFGEETTSDALYDYKAILADAKENLIGFPFQNYYESSYGVFSYQNGTGFTTKFVEKEEGESWQEDVRGTYIGDTFYVVRLKMENDMSIDRKSTITAYDRKDYAMLQKIDL